jgi:hypothetical protein
MNDKFIAQRDVEYFNELLSKETDKNQRMILERFLAEAGRMRQAEEDEQGVRVGPQSERTNSSGAAFILGTKAS